MSSSIKEAQRLTAEEKSFTGGLCFLKNATHSKVVLHARTADVRALGTPPSRATWSLNTTDSHLQRPPRHNATPQGHVPFAAQEVAFPTTSRRQLVQGKKPLYQLTAAAMSPREHLTNTNRVATTRRAWCCVANARPTKRDRTAASSQRASAMRPTICGLPSDLCFAWWLRLRV